MSASLTKAEREHLASIEEKFKHVSDLVRGVVHHFSTGFFLYGEGGTGKSYKVLETLKTLKAKYVYHNSRMTGRGLVDALERSPSDIHLIEDAETLLDDRKSFGVLRSALWSQSKAKPPQREISWTAFKTDIRFIFTGAIVIISNDNLAETIPEIRAIKTRINVMRLDLSNEELLALQKKICLDGYQYGPDYLTPDECLAVGDFIRERLGELRRNLDLRLLQNGFKDMLQWKTGNSEKHWSELLQGRISERPVAIRRADRVAKESATAVRISAMKIGLAERIALWEKETGHKGERGYYRALERADAR